MSRIYTHPTHAEVDLPNVDLCTLLFGESAGHSPDKEFTVSKHTLSHKTISKLPMT